MKRFFKNAIIIIAQIFVLFVIFEAFTFHNEQNFLSKINKDIKIGYKLKYYDWDENYPYIVKYNMRKPFGTKYKNKPIVIFGCSYAYGYDLKDEQSLGYKLSEYTKRPVYNRAFNGFGIQHMLYQLEREDFYKEVPQPEYVIFVYINGHISRCYSKKRDWFINEYLSYEKKNNRLIRWHKFYAPIFNLYSVNSVYNSVINTFFMFNIPITDFARQHFIQSKEMVDKHWKGTKFVVINYDDNNEKEINELEKYGIKIIHVNHLAPQVNPQQKTFIVRENVHATEATWSLLVPKICKELNL